MIRKAERKQNKFLKEKFTRYPLVVFIRKNIYIFLVISTFALTLLLGVWDIKKYEIYNLEGTPTDQKVLQQIEKYFDENIKGYNYFSFSTIEYEEEMYLDIPYIEKIRVEKTLPNKLVIFTKIYKEEYVSILSEDSCYSLSSDGILLEELCEDSEQHCCVEYALASNLPLFKSSTVDISSFENQKDRLLLMEDISVVYKVIVAFKYSVKEIELIDEILEFRDVEGKIFRFNMADDLLLQTKRFVSIMGKVKGEDMQFKTLDLRFERPVMKN
jgi:hypothetical protein